MAQYQFGSGILYGVPNGGNLAANVTPINFGVLQNVSVEITATIKELKGQNLIADDIAVADLKITGKAQYGVINGLLMNQLFFGQTQTVGTKQAAGPNGSGEAAVIPASTPWTVTVSNSATFIMDLGVRFLTGQLPLTRVASAPTAGQYTVSAGVYTFSTTDAGKNVIIGYTFTAAASGTTTLITNRTKGWSPTFGLYLAAGYNFAGGGLYLYANKANKLSLGTKQDDYTIPEFDFQSFADINQNIMDIYTQS